MGGGAVAAVPVTPLSMILLFLAGIVAAAINSVAGGGSLVSFPVLVLLGVPPVPANATNSAALTPGNLSAALGLWGRLGAGRRDVLRLLPATVAGAAAGAWLLVHTSQRLFSAVVTPLLLLATVLLWQRPRIARALAGPVGPRRAPLALGMLLQLLISVYGGYFGAGMGILMLAAFGLFLEGDLHRLNAVRNWLAFVINLVAAVLLLVRGLVWPRQALVLMAGALVGGYLAARISRRVDAEQLRRGIVILGLILTLWFGAQALRQLL